MKIVRFLHSRGFEAFFVGGFVRDLLLKKKSDNIDIATDATPTQVQKLLKSERITAKEVGKKYGTILAILNKFPIEITTFRAEAGFTDKRRPDKVAFIRDFRQDARRRDFSINTLYLNPVTRELYDPVGGLKDLKLKLIRFVGDSKKRINEDFLRMLRAVRLAAQLNFDLEKNTFAAIKTRAKFIQKVSAERIKAELDKILLSKNRVSGIRLLFKISLLKFIFPELESLKNFHHTSKKYHLEGDMFEHSLLSLQEVKANNLDLLYAVLLHDIGKPQAATKVLRKNEWIISTRAHARSSALMFERIAQRLGFPARSRKKISWLIDNHMLRRDFEQSMRPEKKINLAMHPYFPDLLELWRADYLGNLRAGFAKKPPSAYHEGKKFLKLAESKKRLLAALVSGDLILKTTNIKPGPKVGEIKKTLMTKVVLGQISNLHDARKFLKQLTARD